MRKLISIICAAVFAIAASAQVPQLKPEVFDLLNLDYPGLEKVKQLHNAGDHAGAAAKLLDYYKGRTGIVTPDIRDIKKVKINKEQQQWADDALQHVFFVHKGYQPSFSYGEDINWKYWPVKDNELRWQLHRHKWFAPMGRAYRVSGDEGDWGSVIVSVEVSDSGSAVDSRAGFPLPHPVRRIDRINSSTNAAECFL